MRQKLPSHVRSRRRTSVSRSYTCRPSACQSIEPFCRYRGDTTSARPSHCKDSSRHESGRNQSAVAVAVLVVGAVAAVVAVVVVVVGVVVAAGATVVAAVVRVVVLAASLVLRAQKCLELAARRGAEFQSVFCRWGSSQAFRRLFLQR